MEETIIVFQNNMEPPFHGAPNWIRISNCHSRVMSEGKDISLKPLKYKEKWTKITLPSPQDSKGH